MRKALLWIVSSTTLAQTWQNVAGGVDGTVEVLYSWQGALYVGGRFQYAGGTALQTNGIARYLGAQGWQRVGPGQGAGGTGHVYAITEYQGKLIVGGEFSGIGNSSAQNLAAYDPVSNTWSAVGGGVSGPVYALAVYQGELLVGGGFTQVGNPPQPIAFFARWNGSQWLAPDPNNTSQLLMGGVPRAFIVFQNKLYVAGSFVAAYYNETDKAYLAIWNKSLQRLEAAYPAGQGPNNNIWAAVVWNNKLYLGGDFTTFGTASGKLVAFDGIQAQSVPGAPTSGSVRALLATGTDLYVAGSFSALGNGMTVNRIAKLSSSGSWSSFGNGLGPTVVNALAWHVNTLYAGGNFTQDGSGGVSLARIAVFSSSSSLPLSEKEAPLRLLSTSPGEYSVLALAPITDGRIRIVDLSGRIYWEESIQLAPGHRYPIPLPSERGTYLIHLYDKEGQSFFARLVRL
ncbi:MAG: hypothetical protein N2170_01265 [Bacteroidia bacterium]|nr:hypothetical protein [Bacteroidia bacterium]